VVGEGGRGPVDGRGALVLLGRGRPARPRHYAKIAVLAGAGALSTRKVARTLVGEPVRKKSQGGASKPGGGEVEFVPMNKILHDQEKSHERFRAVVAMPPPTGIMPLPRRV